MRELGNSVLPALRRVRGQNFRSACWTLTEPSELDPYSYFRFHCDPIPCSTVGWEIYDQSAPVVFDADELLLN
jgi:hypothetical protein